MKILKLSPKYSGNKTPTLDLKFYNLKRVVKAKSKRHLTLIFNLYSKQPKQSQFTNKQKYYIWREAVQNNSRKNRKIIIYESNIKIYIYAAVDLRILFPCMNIIYYSLQTNFVFLSILSLKSDTQFYILGNKIRRSTAAYIYYFYICT